MKYAVAAMNFFDNELTIKIIHADNWKDAVLQHPQYAPPKTHQKTKKYNFQMTSKTQKHSHSIWIPCLT